VYLRVVFAIILSVASAQVFAQWYDVETRETLEEEPWRKQKGDLGAMLAITNKVESFLSEWKGTEFAHAPRFESVSTVRRGEQIAALVFFSGCTSAQNLCDAIIDFKLLRPDGTTYSEQAGLEAWKFSVTNKYAVQLSQPQLRIVIEPEDPLGKYKLLVNFRRPSSGESLMLEEAFEVSGDDLLPN